MYPYVYDSYVSEHAPQVGWPQIFAYPGIGDSYAGKITSDLSVTTNLPRSPIVRKVYPLKYATHSKPRRF